MDYLKIPVKISATLVYRIVGPSETLPEPAEGFQIDPEPIEIEGVEGKFWVEWRLSP